MKTAAPRHHHSTATDTWRNSAADAFSLPPTGPGSVPSICCLFLFVRSFVILGFWALGCSCHEGSSCTSTHTPRRGHRYLTRPDVTSPPFPHLFAPRHTHPPSLRPPHSIYHTRR